MDIPPTLPPAAQRWLRRALPRGVPRHLPERIRLTVKGETGYRGAWTPMTAEAVHDARGIGFVWRARVEPRAAFWVRVEDSLDDAGGTASSRLWGAIPLGRRRRTPEVTRSELVRNLAELAWLPHLAVSCPELVTGGDEHTFTAEASRAGERAEVRLVVDDGGDVVAAEAAARPYEAPGHTWEDAPWTCTYGDHALMSGIRVPMTAEARFDRESGPFVYWRARLTVLAVDAAGPPAAG